MFAQAVVNSSTKIHANLIKCCQLYKNIARRDLSAACYYFSNWPIMQLLSANIKLCLNIMIVFEHY